MANTFTAKSLADGTITNAQADIFAATANVCTYIKHLTLFCTNAAAQTVQLWLKPSGGTARKWKRFVLAQNEHVDVVDGGEAIILQTGDSIQASTTTNAGIDFWIDGIEETA